MRFVTENDIRYTEQQTALSWIASKLGVVAYRPDYHGKTGDKNTVLFYLKQDEEHNRKVDKQPVHYSRSEARDMGMDVNGDCVYRDHFFAFENSNVNGQLDMDFANFGKTDLRGPDWETRLEGRITFALAGKLQIEHIRNTGGWLELREADEVYNDLNREKLKALKKMYGRLFLGNINYYDEKRQAIISGETSVYEELLDQPVYNFGCSFAVPTQDAELEEMIRAWNKDGSLPKKMKTVEAMTDRVEQLGGVNLIWF